LVRKYAYIRTMPKSLFHIFMLSAEVLGVSPPNVTLLLGPLLGRLDYVHLGRSMNEFRSLDDIFTKTVEFE
jgi:hypothetical protein